MNFLTVVPVIISTNVNSSFTCYAVIIVSLILMLILYYCYSIIDYFIDLYMWKTEYSKRHWYFSKPKLTDNDNFIFANQITFLLIICVAVAIAADYIVEHFLLV